MKRYFFSSRKTAKDRRASLADPISKDVAVTIQDLTCQEVPCDRCLQSTCSTSPEDDAGNATLSAVYASTNGSKEAGDAQADANQDGTLSPEDELEELKQRPKEGFGFPGSTYEEEFDWTPVYILIGIVCLLILLWCIYTCFFYVPPVSTTHITRYVPKCSKLLLFHACAKE
jgi:hypothetical protein